MDEQGRPEPLLDAWGAAEPPAGFADRVFAAKDAGAQDGPLVEVAAAPRPGARLKAFAGAAALAMAIAAVMALGLPRGGQPDEGHVVAEHRQTVAVGEGATAVLEAGAEVSFLAAAAGTRVLQPRGAVFYRVRPGERFEVDTPHGQVRVTGTCFSVEVDEMGWKTSGLTGATIGAALSAAVVVTVYEGSVVLANEAGEAAVEAGQIAVAGGELAPRVAADLADEAGAARDAIAIVPDVPSLAPGAEAADVAVFGEQMRAAVTARDGEIARLREQVRSLERSAAADDGPGDSLEGWFPAGPSQLLALAKRCTLRLDEPPVMGIEPGDALEGGDIEAMGLSTEEKPVLQDAVNRVHEHFITELRQLYVEATGDTQGVSALSPRAMLAEIRDKGADGTRNLETRIAQERAGLVDPPDNLAEMPVSERAVRLSAGLGDELQGVLAQALGPDRARELRAAGGGWPWSRSQFRSGGPECEQ